MPINSSNKKAYKQLSKYYDKLTNSEITEFYKFFIGKARNKDILDMGCGIGSLLRNYSQTNNTYGADESKEMINVAKKKDKDSKYFIEDIRNLKMDKKFDIIICAYDTINHFKSLIEWEKVFKTAYNHIDQKGYFIFDFNTLEGFKNYSKCPVVKKINNDYLIMQVNREGNSCDWNIHFFENDKKNLFKHSRIIIKEFAFPKKDILNLINKYFVVKKIIDNKNRIYIKAKIKKET